MPSARILRIAVASAAALALAACAPRTPPEPIDLISAKTVGIGSTCGATVQREANAIFNVGLDDTSSMKVPEWALDANIVAAFRHRAPPNLEVIDVTYDPSLVTIATLLRKRDDPNALWKLALAKTEPKADLYVVIFPRNTGIYWRGDQGYLSQDGQVNAKTGFGIFTRGFARMAHAGCAAFVFDTRKQQVVRRFSPTEIQDVPRELTPDVWKDYSEDQLRQVREVLSPMATRIGESIAHQLTQESNLVPAAAK